MVSLESCLVAEVWCSFELILKLKNFQYRHMHLNFFAHLFCVFSLLLYILVLSPIMVLLFADSLVYSSLGSYKCSSLINTWFTSLLNLIQVQTRDCFWISLGIPSPILRKLMIHLLADLVENWTPIFFLQKSWPLIITQKSSLSNLKRQHFSWYTFIKYQNQIAVNDGGYSMCHCNHSAVTGFFSYSLLNKIVCCSVYWGCSLIQYKDPPPV